MITKQQQEIIDYLQGIGYGWAKFAQSVEKQGWCSDKQYETMVGMKQRILSKRSRRTSGDGYGGIGCSDSEAMDMGEYF